MFSSNECTILDGIFSPNAWQYIDSICLVQMSVQYSWQYMFSSNECTIYLTNEYMFRSNECTIYLTIYYMFSSNECTIYLTIYV